MPAEAVIKTIETQTLYSTFAVAIEPGDVCDAWQLRCISSPMSVWPICSATSPKYGTVSSGRMKPN